MTLYISIPPTLLYDPPHATLAYSRQLISVSVWIACQLASLQYNVRLVIDRGLRRLQVILRSTYGRL